MFLNLCLMVLVDAVRLHRAAVLVRHGVVTAFLSTRWQPSRHQASNKCSLRYMLSQRMVRRLGRLAATTGAEKEK